jgi:mitochondrial-processing peptidase subunit beta
VRGRVAPLIAPCSFIRGRPGALPGLARPGSPPGGERDSEHDLPRVWISTPPPHATLPSKKKKVTTLDNGLRVASEAHPHAETATVGVWIDAGSRYESAADNGAAHFLEHMAFKGTSSRDARALETEIENMGGHLNAYTSREQTCYYARVFSKDVPAALDILGDILQRSVLDAAAVERERDVILREMQEVEGVPEEVVFDHLHATAFQRSPLGRTILGPAANVRSLTREDLARYVAKNYTAPRMVVAAAGGVDHAQLVGLAKKALGGLPSEGPSTAELVRAAPAHFTGSEVRVRDPDADRLHFALAFKGAAWADPDAVPLMVIQAMLGAWDKGAGAGAASSSPIAPVAALNGLADSFMAFNTNYHDTGLFGVYAVADPKAAVDDLAWAIMKAVSGLAYGADAAAVTRAKTALKASLLFAQDGPAGVAEDIGRQLLVYGRRIPKAELFARIDAVTPGTVQEVAGRYVFDQDHALAAVGDTSALPDYNWFRRRTYMLRY